MAVKGKVRQVRLGARIREAEKRKGPRSVSELLTTEKVNKLELAKGMTDEEVALLIEFGADEERVRKEKADNVKAIKALLLTHATEYKWKTRAGQENGACTIGASTSTQIDVIDLLRLLKSAKKQSLFDTVFSVKVGDAKKFIGLDLLDPVMTVTTKEYGSVSLKVLK